jgi:hypothetical protein
MSKGINKVIRYEMGLFFQVQFCATPAKILNGLSQPLRMGCLGIFFIFSLDFINRSIVLTA